MIDHLRRLALLPVSAAAARFWGQMLISRPECPPLPPGSPRKALVIRLDDIGDLVLTTPLLRELKRNWPHMHTTLVVRPALAELARVMEGVDEILCFDPSAPGPGQRAYRRFLRCIRFARTELKPRHFDLAISPRRDTDYQGAALLMYFGEASNRLGSPESASPEKAFWNRGLDRLLTRTMAVNASMHEIDYHLSFIKELGGRVEDSRPKLILREDHQACADRVLATVPNCTEWIALAPGAGHPVRRWPASSFAELAALLLRERRQAAMVIIGGLADREIGASLHRTIPGSLDLTGRLSLPETAAVLARCRLAVCNDSGPAHLAAAMDTPVLVISCHPARGRPDHSNSPARFAPRCRYARVLQPPEPKNPCGAHCKARHAHCITSVESGCAFDAARELLENSDRENNPTNVQTPATSAAGEPDQARRLA